MEIHAPEGPTHSLKDFAIHIVIVTIGILIAFGLEGLRESWREHRALEEARDRFKQELAQDQKQLHLEMARVHEVNQGLDRTIKQIPELAKTPSALAMKVSLLSPSFYFFRTTAWESASAAGVLAHMPSSELNKYTDAYESVKNYEDAENAALPTWIAVESFFQSRETISGSDLNSGEEKLRTFQSHMQILAHLGQEFEDDLSHTVEK